MLSIFNEDALIKYFAAEGIRSKQELKESDADLYDVLTRQFPKLGAQIFDSDGFVRSNDDAERSAALD